MSSLLGLFGLSGGYSSASSKSQSQTSGTETKTPIFSPQQTGLQGTLADALTSIITGSGYSPQVQALQTQAANQINKTAAGTTDRISSYLASRGMGQSGLTGGGALQTELARESQLGTNAANFAGLALKQFNTGLSDALQMAYAAPGTSDVYSQQETGTGSTSGFGFGVGGGFGAGKGVKLI